MHLQELFVTRTKMEITSACLAIVSFLVTLASALAGRETRLATMSILAFLSAAALAWLVALITRPAFTLRGYKDVVTLLARLAKTSRHRLWTVRTHTGFGAEEDTYFKSIEERLRDHAHPLEDFRRIVRLCPNVRDHLCFLISRFYCVDNASVYYYRGRGPQFDFMIVDGRIGAIGFPMAGGKGNIGAVVLRRREDVEGLGIIFNQLSQESELLFEGDSRNTPQTEAKLQRRLKEIFALEALDHRGSDPQPGTGQAPVAGK